MGRKRERMADEYGIKRSETFATQPVVAAASAPTEIPESIVGRPNPGTLAVSLAAAVDALTKISSIHNEAYPGARYCAECNHGWPCWSRTYADNALGGWRVSHPSRRLTIPGAGPGSHTQNQ